ncbi:MAG: 4-(cytidine 5'-diphospho)-2-C-methyl-D-erythritol kinase [Puniceicoccales bacterium]|jgi:4-diphosphocytidyl-2-C-methyl-D-erythritol kinase|nr:4-(cytidine 5'-diphospho)-2-C-methyl-D-erythritol kinase [Puniceicoccales bacterium]
MRGNSEKTKRLAKIFSPAKINLFFAVTGNRKDGYHSVFSAIFALAFGDELEIFAAEKLRDEVSCEADFFDAEKNSVVTALNIFRQRTSIDQHFSVQLKKNIPAEAGFGGGSSNGARTLIGLNCINENILSDGELIALSRTIGADCPFFVKSTPSMATGIGDVLDPIDGEMVGALKNYNLLIFKPKFAVNTGGAYAELRENFAHLYIDEGEAERRFLLLRNAIVAGEKTLPLFNTFAGMFFQQHGDLLNLCRDLKRIGANAMLTGSGSGFFCLVHRSTPIGSVEMTIKRAIGPNSFCLQTSFMLF